ncbi:hypothetical protein [Romboutsia sp.]|uniref:hypothetical protein n=1 Tax=Romboutsia sp. TaxID=1965302 RepID=UPI002C4344B2|nr:hypothetical protein [Romboutsia sp.]HSQ87985.1 hypothetical protein [Romboutsia sp.]
MYKLIGIRKNGMKIDKMYDNESVAKFEFDVTRNVATELVLYNNEEIVEQYKLEIPEVPDVVTYLLEGQSAFNNIKKVINNTREFAVLEFKANTLRCDWLVLYENRNGQKEQIELYIKGVA